MTSKRELNQAGPPDFFTVEEAAAILRIGRRCAYQQARQFIATNGAEGLPAERFGKQLRVPRYPLELKLGGPITTWPTRPINSAIASVTSIQPRKQATRRPPHPPEQDSLPFIS